MRRVTLSIEEKLVYRREIDVLIPDEWDEADLEDVLERAERSNDMLSDFMYDLKKAGVDISEGWDDSLDSPDSGDVECDDYEFLEIEDEEEKSA